MGIEFELKFRATPQVQEAVLASVGGEEQIFRMQTTYYDTPHRDFAARDCTLRRRMENGVSVCTLKAPTGSIGRREWETECDDIEKALPAFARMGVPQALLELAGAGLIPVCGARFTRIARTVCVADGTVELAADQGILIGNGRELPLCEIEVEQKTCSKAACLSFSQTLAQDFSLVPESKSKFARAKALAQGE